MVNLTDGSALIAPNLEYSIKEDVSVFVAAYFGAGSPPQATFETTTQNGNTTKRLNLQLPSEFGASGALLILGLRIYF